MVQPADLIITDAHVYTVDRSAPTAEAFAVADGRLLAVGTAAEIDRYRGPETVVHPLGGAFVMPGLVDAHNHHFHAGKADLFELTFSAEASYADILQAVREHAAGLGPQEWIIGSSWGSGLIGQISHEEARRGLDEAAGGRPVILTDDSHHNRWVNTRALELAGITATTPDPEGGEIIGDPDTGNPSGLLLEAAGLLVEEAVRKSHTLSPQQYEQAVAHGVQMAHTYGITAFQDAATSLEALQALKALDDRGDLRSWVVSSMTVNDQIFGYAEIGDALIWRGEEFRGRRHRPDFIKIFLDGTPPAHSGAFLHPYRPDTEHGDHFHGGTTMPPEELLDWLRRAAQAGISAKIHCTGDASVRFVLDAVQTLRAEGLTETKFQIAHGQFIDPADLPRFAELGVTAEISPFLWFPGVIADALGTVRPAEEIQRLQPNRSLIDSGALVAGGSDWPVSESPNAWEGIHGLVTRTDPNQRREGRLAEQEAITLPEAIEVFTINGARAMGVDDVTGSLVAGKSADFVVLDRDPFAEDPDQLVHTTVQQTWFAGEKVYAADA